MRRFVPILLCVILALSGWCTFSCFAQVTGGQDTHASCHGKNKGSQHSLMVVQSHPPVVVQHSVPAVSRQPLAFSIPATLRLQTAGSTAPPVFRSLPPLILRL